MTAYRGFYPETGAWNDSKTSDFFWSRNNFGEARPDVMSPLTYSITETIWSEVSFLEGYHMTGNICGRYYANASVSISMLMAIGKSKEAAIEQIRDLLGNVPETLEIPTISLPRRTMLFALPRMIKLGLKERNGAKNAPEFLSSNPFRCEAYRLKIRSISDQGDLLAFWNEEIRPRLVDGIWLLAGATQPLEATMKFKEELVELVGEEEANTLFSNLSEDQNLLTSLGPVVGVARVAQGKMNREDYFEKYGHRGPHESELSYPRPAEDPEWLDKQLSEYNANPVDVDKLLTQRRSAFQEAWNSLETRFPKKSKKLYQQIKKVGPAARLREAVRDELTRFLWVERIWAQRVGELTGLAEDVFLLTIDEILDLLSGTDNSTQFIPARKETYARYRSYPAYPMIIRGAFDPEQWVKSPNRRNDIYDATRKVTVPESNIIKGFAGAAGRIEGKVRILDGPEQGNEFQAGEVLVAVTTNVGWTPLFPRAAAVVTDVGAPLSHAAIVARELGIPAVVGCGSATTRLNSGDQVRVDGGRGLVEILDGRD